MKLRTSSDHLSTTKGLSQYFAILALFGLSGCDFIQVQSGVCNAVNKVRKPGLVGTWLYDFGGGNTRPGKIEEISPMHYKLTWYNAPPTGSPQVYEFDVCKIGNDHRGIKYLYVDQTLPLTNVSYRGAYRLYDETNGRTSWTFETVDVRRANFAGLSYSIFTPPGVLGTKYYQISTTGQPLLEFLRKSPHSYAFSLRSAVDAADADPDAPVTSQDPYSAEVY